jgi:hypothetical protein
VANSRSKVLGTVGTAWAAIPQPETLHPAKSMVGVGVTVGVGVLVGVGVSVGVGVTVGVGVAVAVPVGARVGVLVAVRVGMARPVAAVSSAGGVWLMEIVQPAVNRTIIRTIKLMMASGASLR